MFNNYSIGYYEFIEINGLNSTIEATKEMGDYKKNDLKIVYEENYLNISLFNPKDSEVKNNIDRNLSMVKEFINLYEIPNEFHYNEKDIEIEDIFRLIYNFSFKLKPLGRMYVGLMGENTQYEELKYYEKDHEDYEFKRLFDNYEVCIFKKGELIQKIKRYFAWSSKYSEAILDFLTLNIENDFDPEEYPSKPFIYHGDHYYWASKLLKDMNWRNILFKRFIQKKVYNVEDQTKRLEKRLENEFKKNGFKAVSGYKYYRENKKPLGDLDVCAYKDGYLFLIEMKITYFTSDTDRIHNYEEEQLYSYKASEQLEKGIHFTQNNKEFQKELGIDNIGEVKILPLIVSNSSFGDDRTYHSRYLKISYLELIVILNNSLKRLLNVNSAKEFMDIQYSTLLAGNNLTDPSYNHSMLSNSIKDFNLWSNPKECSGEDVFSAIEQDKVWAEYKKNYNPYIPFRINITRFEESYKLLHIEK